MITLEVNGASFNGFTDITVSRSIETMASTFNFTATINNQSTFPIKVNDACKVVIGKVFVINGFVEAVSVNYSPSSHAIQISGRDRTADVIDSSVVGNVSFIAPIAFEQVIRNVLDNLGLKNIKVLNQAGDIAIFTEGEIISGEIGMSAFDFIEEYARKRQVLLTTDGAGNILLTRGSGQVITTMLLNQLGGDRNNIKSSTTNYDNSQRYNSYTVESQINLSGEFSGEVDINTAVDQQGVAPIDSEIRATRQLVINAEVSSDIQTATERANWEANIRRARSFTYNVKVQGFFAEEDKRLWQPNFLVKVIDDFASINAFLLIKNVTYNFSNDGGSTTSIDFVVKDAYTLQALQDKLDQQANELGEDFT